MDHFIDEENVQDNDDPQSFDNVFSPKSKGLSQMDDEFINHPKPKNLHHLDDFTDEETQIHEQQSLVSKYHNFQLKDEETDEDTNNKNNNSDDGVWVNINDLPHPSHVWDGHKHYIEDDAEEELNNRDNDSVRSLSNGHDTDSFIDDESLGYDTTDDEDDF